MVGSINPPSDRSGLKFFFRAFVPVVDYSYIGDLPSVQLNEKKVNGERLLIGVGGTN